MLINHIELFVVGRIALLEKLGHNSGNPIKETNGQSIYNNQMEIDLLLDQ